MIMQKQNEGIIFNIIWIDYTVILVLYRCTHRDNIYVYTEREREREREREIHSNLLIEIKLE